MMNTAWAGRAGMNDGRLAKYKIGLLAIGIFTIGLLLMVLMQASATKQDAQTDKTANSMADSLNSYTATNFSVPASLSAAGIKKTSPDIKYTKLSASKYKFCVTYKATSSNFDPSLAVDNVLAGAVSAGGVTGIGDTTDTSFLIIPSSHHKGANCQTIDIGDAGVNLPGGGFGCDSGSLDIACPQQSSDSGSGSNAAAPGCGRSYDASSGSSVVTTITTDSVEIGSVGVAPYSVPITPTTEFLDGSCLPIEPTDVQAGDTVIVFSSISVGGAVLIQDTTAS